MFEWILMLLFVIFAFKVLKIIGKGILFGLGFILVLFLFFL